MAAEAFQGPDRDCPLCPRLVGYRRDCRSAHPDWWNGPVPSFGPIGAPLLILGLAPGMAGANRTGRPFTGDWAGDLLYKVLTEEALAEGIYGRRSDDGLALIGCRIANAVRCVPPRNRPVGSEMKACRPFLEAELVAMPNLRAVFTLGRIAHEATLRALGKTLKAVSFAHGARHDLNDRAGRAIAVVNSYHCSRYNTNTGRLTEAMFRNAVRLAKDVATA